MHKVCNLIENIQKVFLFFSLHYCTKAYLVFTAEKHFLFYLPGYHRGSFFISVLLTTQSFSVVFYAATFRVWI